MANRKYKVLLIGKSKEESKLFIDLIEKQGIVLVFASTIEMAIQKSIADLPDLVVSFYELNALNGFHVFKFLEGEILNNEIPFVLIFNQYRKNDLLIAIELGIDSFIIPPFDEERIKNIVQTQLSKNEDRKRSELLKFDSFCNVIPYGIFIAENKRIVETNRTFEKIISKNLQQGEILNLNQIFLFNTASNDELKLARFLNGLTQNCNFSDIGINGRNGDRFNLNFSLLQCRGSLSKIIGIIIPVEQIESVPNYYMTFTSKNNGKHSNFLDADLITTREKEVLALSASGSPIKQIAQKLGISERTVEKHRSNIIQKTNTENIMEAVYLFGKNYMLEV